MKPAIRSAICLAALALAGCGESALVSPGGGIDDRQCGDHSVYRNAYFGDLHVHTSYSFDAYLFGNHANDPEVAYDFAQGARIRLNDNAMGERYAQLWQPLDFAAVTDHSEYLGEVQLCSDPAYSLLAYLDPLCLQFRTAQPDDPLGFLVWGLRLTKPYYGRHHFCITGDCRGAARSAWEATVRTANARNDDCRFTAFNGYEYSPSTDGARLHRNILFAGNEVPETPVSYFDAPDAVTLFRKLNESCIEDAGCRFLSIPHNANLSHGRLLWADPDRFSDPTYVADLREIARLNPVLEMMQVKGNSECKLGLGGSRDEECEYEQIRAKPLCCDPGNGIVEHCVDALPSLPFGGEPNCHEVCPGDRPRQFQSEPDNSAGCVASHDFVRGALLKGMAARRQLGFNPLRFGLIAATDNHNSAAGDVDEAGGVDAPLGWEGAHGGQDDDPAERFDVLTNVGRIANPGGLAGIWAEQNTREALFSGLQRSEVFATSGPRIRLRFFGGDLPDGLCAMPSEPMKARAYTDGVPMGADLPAGAPPRFLVQAFADRHPLQRTEIIKLWVDDAGQGRQKVIEIGRYADPADVTEACEVIHKAPPSARMSACHEWVDPEFDASLDASYYARVLEDRSCRWTGHLCAALERSGDLSCADTPEHPCCIEGGAGVRRVQQERAWSSPIWHVADGTSP